MRHARLLYREYEAFGIGETLEPYLDHPVQRLIYDAAEGFRTEDTPG